MAQTAETADISEKQVNDWRRDGFLILDRFLGDETLEALRDGYDDILNRRVQAAGDRELGNLTRQVMNPSESDDRFRDNPAVQSALRIAQQLLGTPNVRRTFDMLIYKPAGHPHETPWHQDAAYAAMPFAAAGTPLQLTSIQFWIPLDDVDIENGCMQFIPGHSDSLLEHKVAAGSPDSEDRLLALSHPESQIDLSTAVVAEISAGGATLHSPGTLHYTGPNRSANRPRRAYIFNIGTAATAQGL